MRGTTVSTYITLEIEVEVEGTYYSGSPASTLGSPDNWESEDPGQIEISVIRALKTMLWMLCALRPRKT